MLEGINSMLGRIQEIESQFNPAAAVPQEPVGDFNNVLAQMQGPNPPPGAPPGQLPPGYSQLNPALWNMLSPMPGGMSVTSQQIADAAASIDGKQYWPNACAHATNDVLKSLGIDIKDKVNGNPDWVPNYANLGTKMDKVEDLRPGDLVIYNNYLGQGGYDHIGIYAGNGEAWNVSTAAGYKWVKSPIGSRFQEGRRLTAM